jgi:hypothetical protein
MLAPGTMHPEGLPIPDGSGRLGSASRHPGGAAGTRRPSVLRGHGSPDPSRRAGSGARRAPSRLRSLRALARNLRACSDAISCRDSSVSIRACLVRHRLASSRRSSSGHCGPGRAGGPRRECARPRRRTQAPRTREASGVGAMWGRRTLSRARAHARRFRIREGFQNRSRSSALRTSRAGSLETFARSVTAVNPGLGEPPKRLDAAYPLRRSSRATGSGAGDALDGMAGSSAGPQGG